MNEAQQPQWSVIHICDCLRSSFAFVSGRQPVAADQTKTLKQGAHQELANESQNTNQSFRNSTLQPDGQKTTKNQSKLNKMMRILGVKEEQTTEHEGRKNAQKNRKGHRTQKGQNAQQQSNVSVWVDKNEQKKQEMRRQAMIAQKDYDSKKYVFKSLLRQDYFNQRFKANPLPSSLAAQSSRRIAQNFMLMTDLLIQNATHVQPDSSIEQGVVKYCASIRSKKSAYLLKYFPYQCLSCQRYTNEILIVQCGNALEPQDQVHELQESFSCNSAICLECSLKYYQMVLDGNTPVQQCNMCGHSLVIHSSKNPDEANKTIDFSKIQLYQHNSQNKSGMSGEHSDDHQAVVVSQSKAMDSSDLVPSSGDIQVFAISQGLESNFSNIEELEAEHLESSIENNSADKKQIQTSESPNMKFEEIDATDRSLANNAVNRGEDSGMQELELSAQMESNETCLDNLIIRDATDQEKEELKIIAQESVMNMGTEVDNFNQNRCSLLGFDTSNRKVPPQDPGYSGVQQEDSFTFQSARSSRDDKDGYQTGRSSSSHSAQLTGLKPKALIFESPEKQTPTTKQGMQSVFGTTSTKEQTGSGIGFGVSGGGFGCIKLMQCESNEHSPPIKKFQSTDFENNKIDTNLRKDRF